MQSHASRPEDDDIRLIIQTMPRAPDAACWASASGPTERPPYAGGCSARGRISRRLRAFRLGAWFFPAAAGFLAMYCPP